MEIKLKPCPFCGGKAKLKHGFPSRQRGDMRQATVQCLECGCRTVTYRQAAYEAWENVDRQAVETWNNRMKTEADELSNDPLTMDELREMDGEPVWGVFSDGPDCYMIIRWHNSEFFNTFECGFLLVDEYGKSWLAYRHGPVKEAR